jgi:hypothetical protein
MTKNNGIGIGINGHTMSPYEISSKSNLRKIGINEFFEFYHR